MGFWTGLIHGTLMSAAALAALSLAVPRQAGGPGPDAGPGATAVTGQAAGDATRRNQPEPQPGMAGADRPDALGQPETVAAAPAPTTSGVGQNGAADDVGGPTGPAGQGGQGAESSGIPTDRLPDPVGSEFRRGGDDPPDPPSPQPAPRTGDAPVAVAAGPETAPSPAPAPDDRPVVADLPVAPRTLAPAPTPPEPPRSASPEAPIPVAPPGKVVAPAPDRIPERSAPDRDLAAQTSPVVPDTEPVAATQGAAVQSDASRAAPQPVAGVSPAARSTGPVARADLSELEPGSGPSSGEPPMMESQAATEDAGRLDAPGAVQLATPNEPARSDSPPQDLSRALAPDTSPPAAPVADQAPAGLGADGAGATDADPAPMDNPAGTAPSSKRAARPAPDLALPPLPLALTPPDGRPAAPALPEPAAATPPRPDLSDLRPGASD